jgi:methylglutaconyl-CoA hydratase
MPSILYESSDKVAQITLNEPEKRNPLNKVLVAEFREALDRAAVDPSVNVVLLSASGDSFCAGGDLREFQNFRSREVGEIYDEGRGTAGLLDILSSFPKPIVAAVNGPALGGGFGIVCACSIVVASDRARFGATELRLGLFPLVILPSMRAALGDRKALAMSLTGEVINVDAAHELGVVTKVVAPEAVATEAAAIAARIAAFSPYALRLGMEAFRNTTGMPKSEAIRYMNAIRVMFYHSEDLREGATAFLEKRQPQWRGR